MLPDTRCSKLGGFPSLGPAFSPLAPPFECSGLQKGTIPGMSLTRATFAVVLDLDYIPVSGRRVGTERRQAEIIISV